MSQDDLSRETVPAEFREFTASVRECFREARKFLLFLSKQKFASVALIFLTFLLVLAAFIQSCVTYVQIGPLREAAEAGKKQVDLNSQIAEGTQAADVEMDFTAQIQDGAYLILLGLQNRGNSTARDVSGDFTFTVQTQGKKPASAPQTLHIEKGQLRAYSGNPNSVQKTMSLTGITRDTVLRGEQTCLMQGSYHYNNGFDHTITEPACRKIMRRALINAGTVDHWEPDAIDCSQVDQIEAWNAKYAKQIDKESRLKAN